MVRTYVVPIFRLNRVLFFLGSQHAGNLDLRQNENES